jgi:enoyl-CoA hydratase
LERTHNWIKLGGNVIAIQLFVTLIEFKLTTLTELAGRTVPPNALVISAAGEDVFLIGANPAEVVRFDAGAAERSSRRGQALGDRIATMPMPTLAAVNGLAIGGGLEMVLAFDLAIASTKAQFIQLETGIGLIPGFGGTYRLPRRIGLTRANWMTFTAAPVFAETALAWGLVNEVVAPERLRSRAWEIGRQIAANDGPALCSAKALITAGLAADLADSHDLETTAFASFAGTDSLRARVAALMEARAKAQTGEQAS